MKAKTSSCGSGYILSLQAEVDEDKRVLVSLENNMPKWPTAERVYMLSAVNGKKVQIICRLG